MLLKILYEPERTISYKYEINETSYAKKWKYCYKKMFAELLDVNFEMVSSRLYFLSKLTN